MTIASASNGKSRPMRSVLKTPINAASQLRKGDCRQLLDHLYEMRREIVIKLILDFDGGMVSLLGSIGAAIAQVEILLRESGRHGPV
jgi:hypothetical protein